MVYAVVWHGYVDIRGLLLTMVIYVSHFPMGMGVDMVYSVVWKQEGNGNQRPVPVDL